jgi:hypothetical protein
VAQGRGAKLVSEYLYRTLSKTGEKISLKTFLFKLVFILEDNSKGGRKIVISLTVTFNR